MHSRFKNRSYDAVAHLRSSKSFRLSFSFTNSHSHAFQGFLFFIAMWCWHVHHDFVFFLKWERREPLHFGLCSKLWIITPHEPTYFSCIPYSKSAISSYDASIHVRNFITLISIWKAPDLVPVRQPCCITRDSYSKNEFNWMSKV
jgi:hypothetical protein